MLLLQAKHCTLKDVSCTPVVPVAPGITPPFPPGSGYCSLSCSPSQAQLSCTCHRENIETGTCGQVGIDEQTSPKNRHLFFCLLFLGYSLRLLCLEKHLDVVLISYKRNIFCCTGNWESFLLTSHEDYTQL